MNIQQELDLLIKNFNLNASSEQLLKPQIYANWLAQTYYYVVHSTSLLGYSLPYLKNVELKRHFENHLGEESRHDLLVLKDLDRLGFKLDQFPELSLTQALYQGQYYRISFESGTSILGYILYLEAMATSWGKDTYNRIKYSHKNSVLFLKVHAEEDPQHVLNALEAISKLPETEQMIILKNMTYTHEIYLRIFTQLAQIQREEIKVA